MKDNKKINLEFTCSLLKVKNPIITGTRTPQTEISVIIVSIKPGF
jgi:hypothetical protein